MTKEEKDRIQEAKRAEAAERSRQYAVKRFGLADDEVVWYNGGTCYSRVIVTTREAAEKVAEQVKGQYVNGGWFHGMELGGITEDGKGRFDVKV